MSVVTNYFFSQIGPLGCWVVLFALTAASLVASIESAQRIYHRSKDRRFRPWIDQAKALQTLNEMPLTESDKAYFKARVLPINRPPEVAENAFSGSLDDFTASKQNVELFGACGLASCLTFFGDVLSWWKSGYGLHFHLDSADPYLPGQPNTAVLMRGPIFLLLPFFALGLVLVVQGLMRFFPILRRHRLQLNAAVVGFGIGALLVQWIGVRHG